MTGMWSDDGGLPWAEGVKGIRALNSIGKSTILIRLALTT